MNRNNRSGGVKFRELDYGQSPPDKGQPGRAQQVRSREDVLKLFARVNDAADADTSRQKENTVDNSPIVAPDEDDSCDSVAEESQPKEPAAIKAEVQARQPRKTKLDIVRERSAAPIQSNVVDTCTKTQSAASDKR